MPVPRLLRTTAVMRYGAAPASPTCKGPTKGGGHDEGNRDEKKPNNQLIVLLHSARVAVQQQRLNNQIGDVRNERDGRNNVLPEALVARRRAFVILGEFVVIHKKAWGREERIIGRSQS